MEEYLKSFPQVVARKVFGHAGFAVGTSIFAFLDDDRLVVKSESFPTGDLPAGLTYFQPMAPNRKWISIHIEKADEFAAVIEESYTLALAREEEKLRRKAKKKSDR